MSRPPLGRADARPRIHLWRDEETGAVRWGIGPVQKSLARYASVGAALDGALDTIGFQPAVVILEGSEARYG